MATFLSQTMDSLYYIAVKTVQYFGFPTYLAFIISVVYMVSKVFKISLDYNRDKISLDKAVVKGMTSFFFMFALLMSQLGKDSEFAYDIFTHVLFVCYDYSLKLLILTL